MRPSDTESAGPPEGDDVLQEVRRAHRGDADAYARLVEHYEDAVARQMWRFTRDRSAHRQLVQDVFVNAFFSVHSYRGRGPFLHWLRKIAVRTGYAFWRARRRRRREQSLAPEQAALLAEPPEEHDPSEAADLVHAVLGRLPERDRLVLTLLYLEERTVAEIADLLGWSRSMVKVQAWRARKKLRRLMEAAEPR